MNENKYNNPQEDLITSSFKASLLFNGLPQATRDDSLTKITDQLNSFKKKVTKIIFIFLILYIYFLYYGSDFYFRSMENHPKN